MKRCESCRIDYPDEKRFCRACGKPLEAFPPEQPAAAKLPDALPRFARQSSDVTAASGGVPLAAPPVAPAPRPREVPVEDRAVVVVDKAPVRLGPWIAVAAALVVVGGAIYVAATKGGRTARDEPVSAPASSPAVPPAPSAGAPAEAARPAAPVPAASPATAPVWPACGATADCREAEVCQGGRCTADWWCMCYREKTEGGQEAASTGCRQGRDVCQNLEEASRKGGKFLVENGVVRSCRQFVAEHPGDLLGGRDGWQPSKRAGAWQVVGRCVLP